MFYGIYFLHSVCKNSVTVLRLARLRMLYEWLMVGGLEEEV
jgi:hypothetical protein